MPRTCFPPKSVSQGAARPSGALSIGGEGTQAGDDEPKPVAKPRKEIRPAALVKSPYLDTQDDIEGFLDALRRELQDALARGERIQIR